MIVKSTRDKNTSHTSHAAVKTSKESLQDIFDELLQYTFWAENHLSQALPKMAKATYNELLQETLEGQLENTERQLIRLENSFELFALKPVGKKCYTMEGLVAESEVVIENYETGHARDAALIATVQKIQHHEISNYGTLMIMATVLGDINCAKLLAMSKEEEVETDAKLTELAEKINKLAADMEEEEVD